MFAHAVAAWSGSALCPPLRDGCAYYCRGQNTVTVSEKIFNGNRDDPVQIGELEVVSVQSTSPIMYYRSVEFVWLFVQVHYYLYVA